MDNSKWEGSGNKWNSEAIDLFRSFYKLPSPAIYLDATGRKVNFKNFNGEEEYDFLYGITSQSTNVYFNTVKKFYNLDFVLRKSGLEGAF